MNKEIKRIILISIMYMFVYLLIAFKICKVENVILLSIIYLIVDNWLGSEENE